MADKKDIYCPICRIKVMQYDGKAQSYLECYCMKCRNKVLYKPDTNRVELKAPYERMTSSGKRF